MKATQKKAMKEYYHKVLNTGYIPNEWERAENYADYGANRGTHKWNALYNGGLDGFETRNLEVALLNKQIENLKLDNGN